MTKFISPADVVAAIAEADRLWKEQADAAMDIRIAEKSGDETAIAVARQIKADAISAWHKQWLEAKDAVRAALDTLGLDPNAIKPYL